MPKNQLQLDEHSQYSQYLHLENPFILRNNLAFGILLIIQHLILCPIYGVFIQEPLRFNPSDTQSFQTTFAPFFIVISNFLLVLIGFGFLFSYNKRLVLSGMGFTLLITFLSIQWYFIFNTFWTKVNIGGKGTQFSKESQYSSIYLTNTNTGGPENLFLLVSTYRAALTEAVKCGLANSIVFSAILGRAGLLQALIVSILGTLGYELNKWFVDVIGFDYGYTSKIFIFAGFMGFTIGYILSRKQKDKTKNHPIETPSPHSLTFSLIGVGFIWVFFPSILMDPLSITQSVNQHVYYTAPLALIQGLASSTITSISISFILNGDLFIRDFLLGAISGGICLSSASYYVTNPVWAILIGSVAGVIQSVANFLKRKYFDDRMITTFSFSLFGIQGLIGSVFASIWRASIETKTDNQVYNIQFLPLPGTEFAGGLISLAMGVVFGGLVGLLIWKIGKHQRVDNFDDYTYWEKDDGVRFQGQMPSPILIGVSQLAMRIIKKRVKQTRSVL